MYWMLFAVLSCAKKNLEPVVSVPTLPAPQASWYAIEGEAPKDALVAKVAKKMHWNEALSGAAVDLALNIEGRMPRLEDAKWSAVRAGFPYQVYSVIVGDVDVDEFPHDLQKILEQQRPAHIGLVRVRRGAMDRWVAILASGGFLTSSFPREIELGEQVRIEGQGNFRLLSPQGKIEEGHLPLQKQLTEQGEWWIELRTNEVYSSVPLYVGEGTPVENLFVTENMGTEPDVPKILVEETLLLLSDMRQRRGQSVWEEDDMLIFFSQHSLQQVLDTQWNKDAEVEKLRIAGFGGGPVYQLQCQANTVYTCLDGFSWNLDDRKALLDRQIANVGISIHSTTSEVSMILNLASF